jgi:hypothetical protein
MIKLRSVLIISLLLILGIIGGLRFFQHRDNKQIAVEVFHIQEGGWGYDIVIDQKTFIHQLVIPAIAQNNPFPNEELAQKTAELVVQKIKAHKIPAISIEELIDLKVLRSDSTINSTNED